MGDLKNKLLFTWDQEHCTDSGFMCLENQDKPLFLKELSHIWEKKYQNLPWSDGEYSASNTPLVTYPEKALLNPVSLMRTKYMMECLNDATAYGAGSASCCSNQDVMLGSTNKLSTSLEDSLCRSALMTIVL
ncbi:uncharacterized protein LOC110872155 [Helianthus annuus]|nr:uncharacterized protein LOC110872155 [Helianthus annuus]XP_035832354.1 uncharacterized protein LOC110872155 [Helianthus annuus]